LRFGFEVLDANGKVLGQGDDLPALQHRLAAANRQALAAQVN
ncbi:hypothetical protein, partial [Glutamicibacter creatinolyticus]